MEGLLQMSLKDRRKLVILDCVVSGKSTVAQAAIDLCVGYRQAHRLVVRYKADGAAGIPHKSRGRPSGRATSHDEREAIKLAALRYPDSGPTHKAEMLAKHDGIQVNHETLRRWLIKDNPDEVCSPARRHRAWRDRKECFGEMVQLDGSIHDWFEGRAARCFLLVMIDDAKSEVLAKFSKEETTFGVMDLLEQWIGSFGIPASLYVDRKNVYVSGREPTDQEVLEQKSPVTQFGAACRKLEIQIITAHSPQAKGRVERVNRTLQDRLVKEMRIANVCSIDEGNAFLTDWLKVFNVKFSCTAKSSVDRHRSVDKSVDLRGVFCLEEQRVIANDWTIRFKSRVYQVLRIQPAGQTLPHARAKVAAQEWRDGTTHFVYRGSPLTVKEIPITEVTRMKLASKVQDQPKPKAAPHKPSLDHAWRGDHNGKDKTTTEYQNRKQFQVLNDMYERLIGKETF